MPHSSTDSSYEIHCEATGTCCALITVGGWIRLFSVTDGRPLGAFFTHSDSGGISVAFSSDNRFCFAGTYYAWGLACFDVATGNVIWKRRDLKRFYGLTFCNALDSVFAFFNGKAAVRIHSRTGEIVENFRGVKYISASPLTPHILFATNRRFVVRDTRGAELWSVARESFGILDVAWSPDAVAISEVANTQLDGTKAGVRCYSLQGQLLWRYKARNTHVCPIGYCPTKDRYIGIDFTAGRDDRILIEWSLAGHVETERVIPYKMHGEIGDSGRTLIYISDNGVGLKQLS